MDSKLRLLFAMSALPACGPGVADDPRIPDGGDPNKFVQSCVAMYRSLYACYEEAYDGAYGSEGVAPSADYLRDLCREYRDDIEPDEGAECLAAAEEVFACLASLDCAELSDGDFEGPVQDACIDVYRDASAQCPTMFSPCAVQGVSGGGAGCGLSVSACLDGGTYAIECTEAAPEQPRTCACQRDGVEAATVTLPEGQGCSNDAFAAWAEEACAFPEGVFSAFGSSYRD